MTGSKTAPTWVAEFVEPILSAIASQPPSYEDDFDDNSGSWKPASESGCEDFIDRFMKFTEGELILHNCWVQREQMDYKDFVLELDMRFMSNNDVFVITYRNYYRLEIKGNGEIILGTYDPSHPTLGEPSVVNTDSMTRHILIISKGYHLACYVNDQPIYYFEDPRWTTWSPIILETNEEVAVDHLQIWDISELEVP
jgi:hypothetical protein